MTREIKFRAWHKQERKMYTPNYLHFSPDGDLFGVLIKEGTLNAIDEFELMQYTGFKDCKEREIYEDDIILYNTRKYRIIFDDGAWILQDSADFGDWPETLWNIHKWAEVVGNVHENPELLENKK